MPTAREDNPYEGGQGLGTGGKFRKRPYRRTHTTPYDRPPTALRNPSVSTGWLSKIVDPAQKLISCGAQKIFSSVFRKRLPPPPTPILPHAPSTSRQSPPPKSSSQELNHEGSRKHVEPVGTDVSGKEETTIGQIKYQTSPDGSYFNEIEKLLKQKTFTRSEIDSLTALLRSKTTETSIGDEIKRHMSDSLKPDFSNAQEDKLQEKTALENCVGSRQVSWQITGSTSQALDDDFGSPSSLAKAYMGTNPSKASLSLLGLQNQSHLKDSSFLNYQSTPASFGSMTISPQNSRHVGNMENGLVTAKYQGRSAMYKMARMPYSRAHPSSTLKGVDLKHDGYIGPYASSHSTWDHDSLSATRLGAQKRRSSVLENDIGSVGPIRRIRHKPNLLSSRGLSLQFSGSTLSINGIRSGTDGTLTPMKQPVLHGEAKNSYLTKRSTEKIDDTNTTPNKSFSPSSKSSEMASRILHQLDKMVPSKEKLSEFKVSNLGDNEPKKLLPSMLRGQALRSLERVESSRFLEAHQDISTVDKSVDNSSPASLNMHALKQDKVDNGPSKLIVPFEGHASSKQNSLSGSVLEESSLAKFAVPPQSKSAFRMSAHEDFLDVDDDSSPNGTAASQFSKGKDIVDAEPVPDWKATDSQLKLQENSSSHDGKSKYDNPEGSLLPECRKISVSQFVFPSSLSGEAKLQSTLVSEKAASQNQSDASLHASPLFSRGIGVYESSLEQEASVPISKGDNFVFSGEPSAVVSDVVSKRSVDSEQVPCTSSSIEESIPIVKGDKFVSSQEPVAVSPNNLSNKNVDSSQLKLSTPSTGFEKTTFAGANSHSAPANVTSSSIAALTGSTDSTPKVLEINNNDGKTNSFPGVFGRLSEATGGAASTPLPASGLFSFSSTVNNNSNPTNGPLLTSTPFSSSFPPVPTGIAAGTTSSSSSKITSAAIPVFNHSAHVSSNTIPASTSNLSTSVSEPPFAAPSFPKFGASAFSTTSDKPVSATSSESMFAASTNSAATSIQGTGFGSLNGTVFGGLSVSSGSAGSGIFGFNSSSVSSAGNQTQNSIFSGQASGATEFPTLTQSMPSFASSASTGFANNSGSSLFSASTPASSFSSASSFAFNAPASSEANSVSSSSAPSTGIFSSSSWQPSKSTTSFTSSPPSMFTFGSSAAASVAPTSAASTSVPPSAVFSFGAGTVSGAPPASSSSLFPFASHPAATSTQPVFNSPSFQFGSPAPPNNSEMNMEDSMAEDGVQGSTTTAPSAFPPQSVAPISSFVFSSSTNPPGVANPFQFSGQQNFSASQNPSSFQPASSLDFSGGGSFSLGSGGGDKSNRRIVKINRNRQRKK